MKVGIVSMQRVVNYGSFLQAYSLKHIIEDMGNESVFFDIVDATGSFEYAEIYHPKRYLIKSIFRKIVYPIEKRLYQEREYLFKKKLLKYLEISNEYYFVDDCDVVVFGSDEIFNCCQKSPWGQSMALFGANIKKAKKISYAASFGFTTKQLLNEYGLYQEVCQYIKQFSAISVRDSNTKQLIQEMIGEEPIKNLDPVLIYDYPERKKYKKKFSKYIVIYGYDNRICEPDIIEQIKQFAVKNGLKTVALGMQQDWCDVNYLPHPFELLKLIEEADYVVTDTFHGTVFSIKYQKKFATIIRNSNYQKLYDLLETFGLLSRCVLQADRIEDILLSGYNQAAVKAILEKERQKTIRYLQGCLT